MLNYIFDNTESLNLDAKKIAVLGISAGAGLAAGLTLLNRDEAEIIYVGKFFSILC